MIMVKKILPIFLIAIMMVTAANAVTISPTRVTVQGKSGTKANLQFKIYGHPESVSVDFVKAVDLKETEDKIISSFELGKEAQYVVPVDVVINESKDYYLCAVLKKSQSMRLRTCSAVRVLALP
jgi:predicted DNA-binding ArsR family transcriptional regulator